MRRRDPHPTVMSSRGIDRTNNFALLPAYPSADCQLLAFIPPIIYHLCLPVHMSALVTTPRFIFFTDFDGTITTDDCNDYLVDNLGFGSERRRQLQKEVLCDRMSFRDSFLEMFNSITAPYNECLDILRQNIKFDSGFREFYDWTQQNNIPIVILSSGTQHMIRTLLDAHLGPDWDIQIVSNEAVPRDGKSINEQGGWKIEFHDDRFVSARSLMNYRYKY